jgi:endonuclease-3
MSVSNRAATIAKIHKVLGKHYKPMAFAERPVLEQLLYSCCLEDSPRDAADECFARLQESFFDWNEIRVTTVRELGELMRNLTDPLRSATSLKQTLHSVFETIYNFDLEGLRKQNLGAAIKQLQQYRGATPFMVAYVVQSSLGGHSIPISRSGLELMFALGAITAAERDMGTVPGLERAVPKNKGAEFASLFQQLSADYAVAPYGTRVRDILHEIDPESKARLPKRGAKKADATDAADAKPGPAQKKTEPEPKPVGDSTGERGREKVVSKSIDRTPAGTKRGQRKRSRP